MSSVGKSFPQMQSAFCAGGVYKASSAFAIIRGRAPATDDVSLLSFTATRDFGILSIINSGVKYCF